jgi:dipeptidyl aminopeptidase/acylaminoacyl peptidase
MRVVPFLALAAVAATAAASANRPVTPRDIVGLKQVSDPQISPDGTRVVFVVSALDAKENLYQSDLWIVGAAEGEPRRLTRHPKHDRAPAWSADGSRIAFLSEREEKAQLLVMDARGGILGGDRGQGGVTAFAWALRKIIAYPRRSRHRRRRKKTKAKDDERVIDRDLKMAHLWTVEVDTRRRRA